MIFQEPLTIQEQFKECKQFKNRWPTWSSLSCFTVYQFTATNSMQYSVLQIPWNLGLIPLSNTDILQNVWGHSPEFLAAFPGISGNIPPKHSRTFPGIFGNIPQNLWGHSAECLAKFPGMFANIPGVFEYIPRNVWQHSPESLATFPGVSGDILRNFYYYYYLYFKLVQNSKILTKTNLQ